MFKIEKIVLSYLIFSTLIVGNITYFLGFSQAVWIPYLLGIAAYMFHFLNLSQGIKRRGVSAVDFWLITFLAAVFFSFVINMSPLFQVIAGGKNLVGLWGIYLVIAFASIRMERLDNIVMLMLPFAVLQLPFVLYQHFFVASTRSTAGGEAGVAWDAVVGTFGGDPQGGGASGALAFLISFAVVMAITLWRRGQIKNSHLAYVLLSSGVCLAVAEVKVVVVLVPLGLIVVGASMVRENPIFVIFSLLASMAAVVALLTFYTNIHEGGISTGDGSLSDLFDGAFWYSLDGGFINLNTGEMGRMAALFVWWEDGFQADLVRGLFGYGPGASRSSSAFMVGEAARGYAFNIDRSSAVQVLWECGLVGFLLMCAILLSACVMSFRYAQKSKEFPKRRALLESCSAMLLMVLVMMPYSRDFLEVPGMGVIVMLCLGYIVQSRRLI